MASPLFSAVTSSARQLLMLLRCISFSRKVQVRITADGLRFSCEEGSVMEAFIFLERSLFTTYSYNAPDTSSAPETPLFEISLTSLLETLNIFSLSDPAASRRPGGDLDAFAVHRLSRHAAIDAFSNRALGVSGACTFSYDGEGSALSVYMSESGVATTCDLTTYGADSTEDIPFNRDTLAFKTIMRATYLLDAVNELSALNPSEFTIQATPSNEHGAELALSASGVLGSATIEFTTKTTSETPILETFQCSRKTSASFSIAPIKAAQRAMASASKVSLRLDDEGVLSMQFLIELGPSSNASEAVAFVDFRAIPLVEGADGDESDDSSDE